MDHRKRGYFVKVLYESASGAIWGEAPQPGRKAAFAYFNRMIGARGTVEAQLWQNGRMRLRSVRDCEGIMRTSEQELIECVTKSSSNIPRETPTPTNGLPNSARELSMVVLSKQRASQRKALLERSRRMKGSGS